MDEEFILQSLQGIFQVADSQATLKTIEELAAALGVSQIHGMPIVEYFHRKKSEMAEDLIRDFSDHNPAAATAIKAAWEDVKKDKRFQ